MANRALRVAMVEGQFEMKKRFPDDENGYVLSQMQDSGDDLSKPRQINFSVVLPSKGKAEEFAAQFRKHGFDVEVEHTDVVKELPWDVTVSRFMIPEHSTITKFEETLQVAAAPLGGRIDGWGCFERTTEH